MWVLILMINSGEFLEKLQIELSKKGNPWIAGKTGVGDLSWEKKKEMWGKGKLRGKIFIPKKYRKKFAPLDWRNKDGKNWMTPAKNQGKGTGGCWAFAWVGMQEARWKIFNNKPDTEIDLSEQFIISCNPYGYACVSGVGGMIDFGKFIKMVGVVDENCFPYVYFTSPQCQRECEERCSDWKERVYKVYNWGIMGSDYYSTPEETLRRWLEEGPIAITIGAKEDFFYYKKGVYEPIMGRTLPPSHAVVLCGYTENGEWIIKNSFPDWGDNGFGILGSGTVIYHAARCYPVREGEPVLEVVPLGLEFVFVRKVREKEWGKNYYTKPEDTLYYDELPEEIKAWRGASYWGVKFQPSQKCRVIGSMIARVANVPLIDTLFLAKDDWGGTQPGTILEKIPFEPPWDPQPREMEWVRKEFTKTWSFEEDFWIYYYANTEKDSQIVAGVVGRVGGDERGGERSYYSKDGIMWERMKDVNQGKGSDIGIRAIIVYDEGFAGIKGMWVVNRGKGELKVEDMKKKANWIRYVEPKKFTLVEANSLLVRVSVDTLGLEVEKIYTDTIKILSNVGEKRIEVKLKIEEKGIEEREKEKKERMEVKYCYKKKKMYVKYTTTTNEILNFSLYSIVGQKLYQEEKRALKTGVECKVIDLPLKKGVYFFVLSRNHQRKHVKKLIILG